MPGHVTDEMFAGRISKHGQITAVETFTLDENIPFSIFLVPIGGTDTTIAGYVMDAKLYQEDTVAAATPYGVNWWNETATTELIVTQDHLDAYDIYWGTGR